ncbi:hypothetical protein HGRIS_003203 [Hohenbuehelia grisea]|uniref:Neutral metalloproteinase n=1 Tax=Hohenbuehelia grisea TaxID=104357 RepID=A0ABR3JMR3_9AGAR
MSLPSDVQDEHDVHHHCSHVCSIIPPYLLANIAGHPDAPEESRTFARNTLLHTETLLQVRHDFITQQRSATGGAGQSIVPGYVLDSITGSEDVEDDARDAAQRTLATSEGIRETRERHAAGLRDAGDQSASGVEGIAATPARLKRVVYTSENTEILDQRELRSENDPPVDDQSANECYDGFGATFEFYNQVFHRNSINDKGLSLLGSVHYGKKYINAFWNGSQMVFGDGDGGIYWNNFTSAVDVIAHELTHGVTSYTANLTYRGESGALNESISDVFGSMVKQYQLKQTSAEADWLIGAGLFTSRVNGVALRSMKAPGTAYDDPALGKDRQPNHYSKYVVLSDADDSGGVHIYSGIPNRAFYLAATALGGSSWERAGPIWYTTLRDKRLKHTANFKDFAQLTCDNAEKLYDASVRATVQKAWADVGVKVAKTA